MVVSFTIVRYRKLFIPLALLAMAIHRLPMVLNKRCTFWKLFGTGRGGSFSLNPDWQQWGLLAVWHNKEDFDKFKKQSFITSWWKRLAANEWTVLLAPISSHGKWDGKEPFQTAPNTEEGPIAILTRARIRASRLKNFWGNVGSVASHLEDAPGLVMSVGFGEAPVYLQATFSIWKSEEQMKDFAYRSKIHADVIRKTRAENWYAEELFARFRVLETYGTLQPANEPNT